MPFYLLLLFLNIAVNNPCTNYPSTSRTESENNNSLKLRQLQSHFLSPKLAVSFSRDSCIYHIHNHSKMKSSTRGTRTHSFSLRRANEHFKYLRRGSSDSCVFEVKQNAQRSWWSVSWYPKVHSELRALSILKDCMTMSYMNWLIKTWGLGVTS